jgi:hypothetical protein
VFTLAKRFDDEGEVEEAEQEDIEFLEAGEDSAEAVLGPAIHLRVDRVPAPETLRQTAAFAAVLSNIQHRVQHLQVDRDLRKNRRFIKEYSCKSNQLLSCLSLGDDDCDCHTVMALSADGLNDGSFHARFVCE